MTRPGYGHPLQFGVSLTPRHDAADAVVALAQRCESLGYDLVTFQDHPYQPRFLDTWTLLTWVASRTDRIRVAGNVLNVPMRPPAVLARASVSLDQLSGGRFDLALGAGGFWDAIEAMGGRRLTPGQAVQALEEAIDIIRGIWDVGDREPLRVPGEFHQVNGAKRGPHQRTAFRSGSAPTGRECSAWSAAKPMAGCPRSAGWSPVRWAQGTGPSTRPRSRSAGIRGTSAGS